MNKKLIIGIVALLLIAPVAWAQFSFEDKIIDRIIERLIGEELSDDVQFGGAALGTATRNTVATTSAIGPQELIMVFDGFDDVNKRSKTCSGRAISLYASDAVGYMTLLFEDFDDGNNISTTTTQGASITLNGVNGVIQNGTSTTYYDADRYGCGTVYGFSEASTTITAVEFD